MPESKPLQKVLIANRGEIAVRVIRACKDAGIGSVAVYAEPDRDALFVRLADEAHSLGGATPADSYLDIEKIIAVAERSGADSVHPGYGFLAENAEFAQAVIDAGLIWIGPPPAAIENLGDKVKARHIAEKVGAPLAPGTKDPVKDADEVVAFAEEYGLPIAIKAAFGGGGRGLKVARTIEEVADAFESAVREAVSAFGRGECFVEKFLDKPRHVETQCLADQHGNVVVVSTRDCSLQRRHQKLVEEAPAPFLTDDQVDRALRGRPRRSSRRPATSAPARASSSSPRTAPSPSSRSTPACRSSTRVSEEVTGIDLVREMFRIAAGEELGYDDPEVRGHSIEFRINAEDGGRNFMPAPGTLSAWRPPSGPGVRLDGGYEEGETIPGSFDSLVAKLIVSGRDRTQALERSRRALDEFVVDGMPTVIPFHRVGRRRPGVHRAPLTTLRGSTSTRPWIETDFDNQIEPYAGESAEAEEPEERQTVDRRGRRQAARGRAARRARRPGRRRSGGRREEAQAQQATRRPVPPPAATRSPARCRAPSSRSSSRRARRSPRATPSSCIEAMKMEQPLKAHKAGTVTGLQAEVGATVTNGAVICEIKD